MYVRGSAEAARALFAAGQSSCEGAWMVMLALVNEAGRLGLRKTGSVAEAAGPAPVILYQQAQLAPCWLLGLIQERDIYKCPLPMERPPVPSVSESDAVEVVSMLLHHRVDD